MNNNDRVSQLTKMFSNLRQDVRDYFAETGFFPEKCRKEKPDHSRVEWGEYHEHKNDISNICGWGAGDKYDKDDFDKAMDYLIEFLGV